MKTTQPTTAPLAAPAQGETPHKVACRLLNESDPNNVDKWREVNAVEAIITPLVRELNEAKADVLRGIQRDAARLVEDTARAGELATLRQSVARLTQERDEARDQWRMSSVCRELQAKLTAAESELAELRKDRERLVSDSRLVWRSNKFLREAFVETINGLKEKLNTRYYTLFDKPQQSSAHLSWMLSELERHLDDFPADKTGRWIGYVQGCLACNDLLNVDEERDRTRPLFRKAYDIDAARNQQEKAQ